jgi:hypothetical protein
LPDARDGEAVAVGGRLAGDVLFTPLATLAGIPAATGPGRGCAGGRLVRPACQTR